MKKILIPMANGAEDIELISIIDILKRAQNMGAQLEIIAAALDGATVQLDSGMQLISPENFNEAAYANIDAIALAGGLEGMNNLKKDERVLRLLKNVHTSGGLIAAICASPIVLAAAGVLSQEFTCYPGCEAGLPGKRLNEAVVVRNRVITGAGPIVSMYFALEIVKQLGFIEQYEALRKGLLIEDFGIKY